jgi:predicted Zn-dependent peptidase
MFRPSLISPTSLSLLCLIALTGCSSRSILPFGSGAPRIKGAESISVPRSKDLLPVYEYRLENGLEVYLIPNKQEPRFYAEVAVRTGSRNDPAQNTGLAHYLEHLLFKGTTELGTINYAAEKPHLDRITELYEEHFRENDPERRKTIYAQIDAESQLAAQYMVPNELTQLYQVLGGTNLNAHTWLDETVYKVDLPANRFPQWAMIESARFRDPVFRGFHTELQIVYEEKNRAMDNKDRVIMEAVNETLYLVHPYGQQTTLGNAEHLRRPSLVTIQEYFNTYYVPNNMAIIISGDIDVRSTMTTIVEHFGSYASKPLPAEPTWNEPELDSVRRVEVNYPGEETVMIAFRTVPNSSENRYAAELIDMILDNQTAGLINLNINLPQLARSAGAYPMISNDYGAQYLWGVPKEGQTLEQVEALLLEQITAVKNGNFPDDLLPAIVNDFRKSRQLELETNEARVNRLRDVYLSKRSWSEARNDLDRYSTVTKEDVVRVAKELFGTGYVVGYRRDGQNNHEPIEPPTITQLSIEPGRQSDFAATILKVESAPIEPLFLDFANDIERQTVSETRTYFRAHNPVNQLFTLSLVVEKGTNHEPRLALLSQLMNKAGTKSLDSEEFKKSLYRLGTDLTYSSSDNQTAITLSGLDDQFEPSLILLQEYLSKPAVEEDALSLLVERIIKQREDNQKEPQSVSRAASWFSRYGELSPMREELSNTVLKSLTTDAMLELHQSVLDYQQLIAYVGPRPLEDVIELVETRVPPAINPLPVPERRVRPVREVTSSELLFVELDKVQSQVRIESTQPDAMSFNVVPALVFDEYFGGGMSGLVFQEIRESRALAYSAGAAYVLNTEPKDVSLLVQVAGTQAEQTNTALSAMLDLMLNVPEQPDRFEQAKIAVENRLRTERIGFRALIAAVRQLERMGYTSDPKARWMNGLNELDYNEFMEFYKSSIQNKPVRITVVGNSERIGELQLPANITRTSVPVESIFPKQ